MRTCDYPGCDKPHEAKGYCTTHYARLRKHGDPGRGLEDPLDRFARNFTVDDSDCWVWTASQNGHGYGRFTIGHVQRGAHRWLYETTVEPTPEGMDLDHLCRNRLCVNPDHLEPVTRSENISRGSKNRWQTNATHCKRDHEFTPENTYEYNGRRHCRTCRREAKRAA